MKKIIFLLLIACQTDSQEKNIFANESLIKYNKKTLGEIEKKNSDLKGVALCHEGKFQEGLDHLKQEVKTRKNDPEYWNQVGNCYFLNNNLLKAKFYYNYSLETAKKNKVSYPAALNNIGIIYLGQKNIKAAFDIFQKVQKENPNLVTPVYNLGQIYLEYGYFQKAIESFEKLYQINQKDPSILSSLALSYKKNKNYPEAVKYFSMMSSKDLKISEDYIIEYTEALIENNQLKEARKILKYIKDPTDTTLSLERRINEGLKK